MDKTTPVRTDRTAIMWLGAVVTIVITIFFITLGGCKRTPGPPPTVVITRNEVLPSWTRYATKGRWTPKVQIIYPQSFKYVRRRPTIALEVRFDQDDNRIVKIPPAVPDLNLPVETANIVEFRIPDDEIINGNYIDIYLK